MGGGVGGGGVGRGVPCPMSNATSLGCLIFYSHT